MAEAVWAATAAGLGSAIDTENASLPSNRVSLVVGSVKLSEVTAGLEKVRVPPDREMPCPGTAAIACATSVQEGVAEIRRLGRTGGECQVDRDRVAFRQRGAPVGTVKLAAAPSATLPPPLIDQAMPPASLSTMVAEAVGDTAGPWLGGIDTEKASLPSNRVSLVVGSVKLSEVTAGLENVRMPPAREIPCPGERIA